MGDAMVTVQEGFYRWSDIVWTWGRSCSPYNRNAIYAVMHQNALGDAAHPLRENDKKGIELYIGSLVDGSKMLLFSLKQIEYVVEYIHHLRLNDPSWLEYLAAVKRDPASKLSPPAVDPAISRVPLPNTLLPKELFVNVVPVIASNIKQLVKQIRKENTAVKQGKRTPPAITDLSDEEKSVAELPTPPDDEVTFMELNADTVGEIVESISQQLDEATAEAGQSPDPADYFDLAQQALFAASQGGTFKALEIRNKDVPNWNTTKLEEFLTPAVGRGLFVALEMRFRDEDPSQVVDLGYAATWFAPNPNDRNTFDAKHESSHWVALEERERNGIQTSDYVFGHTKPFPRCAISSLINRKLATLWLDAGKGPVYILMHSSQSDYTAFGTVGLDVGDWHTQLHPDSWSYPAHATPEGLGERLLLDTSVLWAAVEAGQEGDKTEFGVTTRTVRDILELIQRGEYASIDDTKNSGNKAMMTFILFNTLINRPLKLWRELARLPLIRTVLEATNITVLNVQEDSSATMGDRDVHAHAAVGGAKDDAITTVSEDDSDYDSDFEGVGAFYVDESGQLRSVGDEDSDDE